MSEPFKLSFRPPGPVSRAYMLDRSFVRGIRGPVGSAKSTTSIMALLMHWMQQEPCIDGRSNKMRKTRTAIIRNTTPMLKTTTKKTYEEWLPVEVFGATREAPPPMEHEIDLALGDGTRLISEVMWLALDRPEDVRKLLSLELTLAFTNETRELPKTIIDGITQRLRRYPAEKDGGATFTGLLMDTNPPDEDHWWPIMAGEKPPPEWMSEEDRRRLIKPDNWKFFVQPPGMVEIFDASGFVTGYGINPEAENIQNLNAEYYPGMVAGKSKAWIDVYLMNRYGSTAEGRPVQPDFRIETHKSKEPVVPIPGVPIVAGADFGLTPACVFAQRIRGRWLILHEIVLENAGATKLAAAINRVMAERFPRHKLQCVYGDPSGDNRAQSDESTPFQILRAAGINARPVPSNDPEIRRAAGAAPLIRLEEGQPGAIFDATHCPTLIAGLGGSWCYKRIRSSDGSDRYHDVPEKTRWSHVGEAYEYLMQGSGEAREVLLSRERKEAEQRAAQNPNSAATRAPRDPLARLRRPRTGGRRGF